MSSIEDVLVLIPSYCPPDNFPQLIEKLQDHGFKKFLVVNDGSPKSFDGIFDEISKRGVKLVTLTKNSGKGAALRMAIQEVSTHFPESEYLVFCDDDGQHDPDDIKQLCASGINQKQFLIGSRDIFKMPFKSFIGNFTMKIALKYLKGIDIPDTQSGLRFMNRKCADLIKELDQERFSFEMQALLLLKKNRIPIEYFPVKTIYFNNNSATRFLPLRDSIDVIKSLLSSTKKKDTLK